MKYLLTALLALFMLATPTVAQDFPGQYYADPQDGVMVNGQFSRELLDVYRHVKTTGYCDTSAVVDVTAAATDEIVALTAGDIIYVCSIVLSADTIATTATISYGTGTTCGTGNAALSGAIRFADEGNVSLSAGGGGYLMKTAVSNAFCIAAATGAVTGFITYKKF